MSTDPVQAQPHAIPRPGVVKALGVCNLVFSVLSVVCILSMSFWYIAAFASGNLNPKLESKVDVQIHVPASTGRPAGTPAVAAFNPFMGMDDWNFVRFSLVENGVGLLTNGLMFVTGIGLLNLRRWGARWWGVLSWVKIGLAVVFWGYYIVAVAPGFSENMAKNVMGMFAQQGIPAGRGPTVADLTRVYSIMNLILAVGAILTNSIYPVVSLVLLGRPGVKAAIADPPLMEPKLP